MTPLEIFPLWDGTRPTTLGINMKNLILLIGLVLLAFSTEASNPTFQSFDTNAFIVNATANTIKANTSAVNPNALVTQAQLGAVGVAASTVTNIVNFIATNNYVSKFGAGSMDSGNITWNSEGDMSVPGSMSMNTINSDGGLFNSDGMGNINVSGVDVTGGQFIGNGSGITNLPFTSTDSSWPNITNYVRLTNTPPTSGQFFAFTGVKDAFGSYTAYPTNPPSGGSTPNGLVTNNSPVPIVALSSGFAGTNTFLYLTNALNGTWFRVDANNNLSMGTNGNVGISGNSSTGLVVNCGNSNIFFNFNWLTNNSAPTMDVPSGGLHTLTVGKGWTNDIGCRATMVLEILFNKSATVASALSFHNTTRGRGWTNQLAAGLTGADRIHLEISGISPGDIGTLSDVSGSGASVIMNQSWWTLSQ